MKQFSIVFSLLFGILGFAYTSIITTSNNRLGGLTAEPIEEDGLAFPQKSAGIAEQGRLVYIREGCVACHTQQVRKFDEGSDYARGWGNRETVARDYIHESPALLGRMRIGPDLMNIGERTAELGPEWHHKHLYAPQEVVPGSNMPPFRYLYKVKKIRGESRPGAFRLDDTEAGFEIVPTDDAKVLVAYLMSLKLDYELVDAQFTTTEDIVVAKNITIPEAPAEASEQTEEEAQQ